MKILIPTREELEQWLTKRHYAKRIPSIVYSWGCYIDNRLVGVCTFGIPASNTLCMGLCGQDYQNNVLELNRLCLDDSLKTKNLASSFVSACIRRIDNLNRADKKYRIIVSYADDGQGHKGYIYQALNFLYTGKTKERTDIDTGENKHSRHYEKTDEARAKRKLRTSKHRYVLFLGTKADKKILKSKLKYKVLPYPKGENKNYDTSIKLDSQMVLL